MSAIQPLLEPLANGEGVAASELQRAIVAILNGEETPALIAALLMGLRTKGESANDIGAAVAALRETMVGFSGAEEAMDIVGTGGDNQYTLNISTTTAIVTAACGVKVAKHGNRAASSISGASDVLGALGVNIQSNHDTLRKSLTEANIAFLWAPQFHPGMRHSGPIRAELKIKTLFNYVGPLCNPAGVKRYLLGCSSAEKLPLMMKVLQNHGVRRAWGVYGDLGLDELSITGRNQVIALENGQIREFMLEPKDADLPTYTIDSIRGNTPENNAEALRRMLEGEGGGYRAMVIFNTAAALVIAEKAITLAEGALMAAEAIDNGKALATLGTLVRVSQEG